MNPDRSVLICPVCGNTTRYAGEGHTATCAKGHTPTPMVRGAVKKGMAR